MAHIKLASRLMQSAAVSSRSSSPSAFSRDAGESQENVDAAAVTLRNKLSADELVELVLAAAQEYFDACATLDDPDLELARQVSCFSQINFYSF